MRKRVFNNYQKRNKFNAQKTAYKGTQYHSKKEASYAMELDWRVKAGELKSWTGQHKFELYVNEEKICNYYIDFRAVRSDGVIEYIEVKGFETNVWRLKWRITKAVFNDLTKGEKAKLVLIK